MSKSWEEVRVSNTGHLKQSISVLSFDPCEELIWAGTTSGRIFSEYLNARNTYKYTSFVAYSGACTQLIVKDAGIFCLGQNQIALYTRRGLNKWRLTYSNGGILTLCDMRPSRRILASSFDKHLLNIDTERGEVFSKTPTNHNIGMMRKGRLLCCSTNSSKIELRDPRNLSLEMELNLHKGNIHDMDISGNTLIVSCFSRNEYSDNLIQDKFVRVFDIRMGAELSPVPLSYGPQVIRFHPQLFSTFFTVSRTGSFQLMDVFNPTENFNTYQANTLSLITTAAISQSGNNLLFGEYHGDLLLWINGENSRINNMSRQTEFSNITSQISMGIHMDYSTNILVPKEYSNSLLSKFPDDIPTTFSYKPVHIPQEILSNMKVIDSVGYCDNSTNSRSRKTVSNQRKIWEDKSNKPVFYSERNRLRSNLSLKEAKSSEKSFMENIDANAYDFPKQYRKVEIKYSKFGVEDFDFGFFNKSEYSGLESHIENCYSNSLLQVLFFTFPLRNIIYKHTYSDCETQVCISCELGFLFKMLETSKGGNCQATNLLRALSNVPNAKALGLLDPEINNQYNDITYHGLIQNLSRFLLERINKECKNEVRKGFPESKRGVVGEIYGLDFDLTVKCEYYADPVKYTCSFFVDLVPQQNQAKRSSRFVDILSRSINTYVSTRAWCKKCNTYCLKTQSRSLVRFPNVLSINAGGMSSEHIFSLASCESRAWIPARLLLKKKNKEIYIQELDEKGVNLKEVEDSKEGTETAVYDLIAVISEIKVNNTPSHLVAEINAGYPDKGIKWHVFNDFLVTGTNDNSHRNVTSWKVPAIIQYIKSNINDTLFLDYAYTIDRSVLSKEILLNTMKDRVCRQFYKPLTDEELNANRGMLCAIDAEFVVFSKEEAEIRSDGTRSLVRPPRYSLARVSVIRGEGPEEGVPFIDEYIATSETISDYLTEFSGINPGDLDAKKSLKPLVSLKSAYKKLRTLVDLGYMFIGHGLKKDFRTINILVPPSQVHDTVDIFFLDDRLRRLSLKFLAWHILDVEIQKYTHDSIEDAQMALKLYKKYLSLLKENKYIQTLEETYETGKKYNFKPPWSSSKDALSQNSSLKTNIHSKHS